MVFPLTDRELSVDSVNSKRFAGGGPVDVCWLLPGCYSSVSPFGWYTVPAEEPAYAQLSPLWTTQFLRLSGRFICERQIGRKKDCAATPARWVGTLLIKLADTVEI